MDRQHLHIQRTYRGDVITPTPAGLIAQAKRLRGWSLRWNKTVIERGGTLLAELRFENRGGFVPPHSGNLRDFDGYRVLGVTNSVQSGTATVWVRLREADADAR